MERHSTDMVSLVFGLLFTAVAVVGLTDLIDLGSADVRWIAPAVLVLFGVLLVLPIGRGKQRGDEPTDEPTRPPDPDRPAMVDAEPAGAEAADPEPAPGATDSVETDADVTDADPTDADDTDVEDR